MQASLVLPLSPMFNFYPSASEFAETAAKVNEDFGTKMKLEAFGSGVNENLENEESLKREALGEKLEHEVAEGGEDEEEEEEFEFSFASTNPDGSPISADDIFVNGQIRPVFPVFNRDLLFADAYDGDLKTKVSASGLRPPLKKLFIEERDTLSSSASESDELERLPEGTYCEWTGKAVEASSGICKKCNSTGFSKLRRFRDLVKRSHSDGKDAFVFLNHSAPSSTAKQNGEKAQKKEKVAVAESNSDKVKKVGGAEKVKGKGKVKGETASSAHEKHYVMNRAQRQGDKRKTYLPYRQDLVGFFTSVNGLSRNVHPF